MIEIEQTVSGKKISLRCIRLGKDIQVIISGGREHIGAVALGQCYGGNPPKVNTSVISAYGHREDELALRTARVLSKALGVNVAVSAGIHFDNLAKDEIAEILLVAQELSERLIVKLNFDLKQGSD